jgi:hypothetical protein
MKRKVLSDGIGRELVFPGASMTKEQAERYGDRKMPKDLERTGFKTHVFSSDLELHGDLYYRITYGKDC